MKKVLYLVLLCMLALNITSCMSKDAKEKQILKEYETAYHSGDEARFERAKTAILDYGIENFSPENKEVLVLLLQAFYPDNFRTESTDRNNWLYGEWECRTPYGTMSIEIYSNGKMWTSTEGKTVPIDIEEDRIWANFGQYGSSYPLDRTNERIGTGEPGYWFHKVD